MAGEAGPAGGFGADGIPVGSWSGGGTTGGDRWPDWGERPGAVCIERSDAAGPAPAGVAGGGIAGPAGAGAGGIDPGGTGTDGTLSDWAGPGGGIGSAAVVRGDT